MDMRVRFLGNMVSVNEQLKHCYAISRKKIKNNTIIVINNQCCVPVNAGRGGQDMKEACRKNSLALMLWFVPRLGEGEL